MAKKRILVVVNRYYPQFGGAEIVTNHHMQELGKHMLVEVTTPRREDDVKRERYGNVTITRLKNWLNPFNRFPDLSAKTLSPCVFFKILFGSYDVIHCFPAVNYNNVLAILAAKIRRIPIFLTSYDLHDYGQLMETGACSLDDIHQHFDDLPLSKLHRLFLKHFNAVFTISERETRVIQRYNANTYLSKVPVDLSELQLSVDLDDFRQRYGIPKDKRIILDLGRVDPVKGQDILVNIMPEVHKRLPDVILLLVGRHDFHPKFYAKMQDFIAQNKLEHVVRFTGGIAREDVVAALHACSLHVFPMRFENSGAVVVETWACKRPVLQSLHVDPNFVEEGVNGYTYSIDDPEDMLDKIVRMMDDPQTCMQMGEAGYRMVVEGFQYKHLVAQQMGLYDKHQ